MGSGGKAHIWLEGLGSAFLSTQQMFRCAFAQQSQCHALISKLGAGTALYMCTNFKPQRPRP
eukprot:1157322-Pelagomonas_calceolata.AAC.7